LIGLQRLIERWLDPARRRVRADSGQSVNKEVASAS
jgi:hypothetical protein